MMIKEGCQCFTCRHGDEPRVVAGYLQGYIEACDWFLNWAKENNIKAGSIADNDLSGIVAQMECNRTESACLLSSPKIPDIEKVDLQQIANMELRDQLEIKDELIKYYRESTDFWQKRSQEQFNEIQRKNEVLKECYEMLSLYNSFFKPSKIRNENVRFKIKEVL